MRVCIKRYICLFLFLFFSSANAEVILGSGYSSMTGGRTNPIIYTGMDSSNFALTLTAVGVNNDVYYHSGYIISAFAQKDAGDLFWGKIRGGIGGGIHFAKRGYTDGSIDENKSDFAVGPSMRVTWEFLPFVFVGVEALYGIRNFNVILLNTQTITNVVLGVRF